METPKPLPLLLVPALVVGVAVLGLTGSAWRALACGALAGLAAFGAAAWVLRPLRLRLQVTEAAVRALQPGERAGSFRLAAEQDDPLDGLGQALDQLAGRYADRLEALGKSESTLAAVLDGMADGIWVTDATGTIIRHNDALKELLYAGHALVGQRPIALLRSNELHEAVLKACAQGTTRRLELTLEGVRPRTVAVHVRALGRELSGSAAAFHDITELRHLEQIRKDFVANVSHELRTPITAIRGYAETLQSGALTDPEHAPKMVEIIHRQSERLSELVEDLLELSRLESGQLKLHTETVPLAQTAAKAADAVRPKAAQKQLELLLVVPPELTAQGDPRAIEQVLVNLLDNAVKYTPAGGKVRLTGGARDGRTLVEVEDSGVGMEAKHLPRVFERFYRVDKGRSRDMGGTGLGLSIVKHLMTAMGGDVRVASQPGKGSTFTVVLPAAHDGGQ